MAQPSRKWSQLVPALAATIGAFGCGTMIAWPAPALPHLDTEYCQTDCDISLTTEEASWVASVSHLGCVFVGPFAGFLMPRIGKKWTMIILAVPFVIGWVLLVVATNAPMLYIGRLLTGFSAGAFALLAPSYTSEIAEPSIKGALGSLQQLVATCGVLFVTVVGKYVTWQVLSAILLVFPTVMAVWMFFMPKSPVFLMSKGKREDAKKSLLFLRGPNFDAETELDTIEENVAASKNVGRVGFITLISHKVYLVPILLSMVLMFLQQFSGVNAVISYAVQIFKDAGLDDTIDPFLCNILVAVSQCVFVVVSMLLVDRFGRKILLIVSDLLMGLSLIALGVYFYLKFEVDTNSSNVDTYVSEDLVKDLAFVPLVALLAFIAAFSIGFGPLPWVMNSELFSKEAKAPASAFCASFNWLCSFLVVKNYAAADQSLHTHNTYFFFGGVCLLGTLFIMLFVPETKGRTEEDMKNYFLGKTVTKEVSEKENSGFQSKES